MVEPKVPAQKERTGIRWPPDAAAAGPFRSRRPGQEQEPGIRQRQPDPPTVRGRTEDIVTPADVQALLKTLYRAALLDDLIGPVFWTAGMRLETHLPRIAAFWEMTLLGSGTYTGSPLALHRLNLARPTPEAKWVVFYSLGDGPDGGVYYDAHPIEQMSHHLTMLAYDMNDEPLSLARGTAAAAQREPAGLQAGQVGQRRRVLGQLQPDRRRLRRLQPRPRVLRLPPDPVNRRPACSHP